MVASPVHPAGQCDGLTDVRCAKLSQVCVRCMPNLLFRCCRPLGKLELDEAQGVPFIIDQNWCKYKTQSPFARSVGRLFDPGVSPLADALRPTADESASLLSFAFRLKRSILRWIIAQVTLPL